MNIQQGIDYVKNIDKKKLIMPMATLFVVIAIVVAIVNVIQAVMEASKPRSLIDLDMIEADGSFNEREMFREITEQRKAKELNYRRDKF